MCEELNHFQGVWVYDAKYSDFVGTQLTEGSELEVFSKVKGEFVEVRDLASFLSKESHKFHVITKTAPTPVLNALSVKFKSQLVFGHYSSASFDDTLCVLTSVNSCDFY